MSGEEEENGAMDGGDEDDGNGVVDALPPGEVEGLAGNKERAMGRDLKKGTLSPPLPVLPPISDGEEVTRAMSS